MTQIEAVKNIDYYLALPYTSILRRDEEGDVIARIQELPGCIAHGDTEIEALANLREAQKLWIEDCLEDKQPVPEPEAEEELPSGKWLQRVPRTLHKRLAEFAKKEGVSFNQLVTNMLQDAVTGKTWNDYIAELFANREQVHSAWGGGWPRQTPVECTYITQVQPSHNLVQGLVVAHKLSNQNKNAYNEKEITKHTREFITEGSRR